jgi:hypothetical protein
MKGSDGDPRQGSSHTLPGQAEMGRSRLNPVRFEVFTAVTMKNVIFRVYKTPVRTSQETHYVSATVPRRLMLCKI